LIEWYGAELLKINQQEFQAVLNRIVHQCKIPRKEIEYEPDETQSENTELYRIQVDRSRYHHLQRNAASVKGDTRVLPKPIVLQVQINGHPARALVDSGLLGDFISSTLADQLKVRKKILSVPLGLQLAVQGSRSKINTTAEARIQYQGINDIRHFDVINLNNYDIILGTPWLYQHEVCMGFNPA
jgi:hypothetical protein